MKGELFMEILAIVFKVLIYLFIIGVGSLMYKLYSEKINNEQVKSLVKSTVKYVEQVFSTATGEEKLNEALRKVSLVLASKNINISTEELEVLIEEAVLDCKELFEQKKGAE
jgi:hypothetical protein